MTDVILSPFTAAEFDAWYAASSTDYAREKVRAGNWPAEGAAERALLEMQRLLPQREATPGHHIFGARAGARRVGSIWLNLKDGGEAFVYDLVVAEDCRGKGYGEAIMRAGEAEAKARGARRMGLHVFGFNTVARSLYAKLGYEATNIHMAKQL